MHSTSNSNQRDVWLDALKGFAILCIIIGHTIERTQTGTGYINAPLHFIDVFVNRMHIYIFFMVSGFLYARFDRKRIKENSTYTKTYIWKKFCDFMLPYLLFAILIWIGKMAFSAYVVRQVSILDLILMLVRPVAFMWFIYVLFVICVLVVLFDRISGFNNKILVSVGVIFLIAYIVFVPEETLIKKTLMNFLPFVVGILIFEHIEVLDNKIINTIGFFIASIICVLCYIYEESSIIHVLDAIHSIVVPFVFVSLFYHLRSYSFRLLDKLGVESLYLYIIHPVAINFVRMIFLRVGIKSIPIWLISLITAGIVVPYVYAILAKKYALFEVWFKPRGYIEKYKKREQSI